MSSLSVSLENDGKGDLLEGLVETFDTRALGVTKQIQHIRGLQRGGAASKAKNPLQVKNLGKIFS